VLHPDFPIILLRIWLYSHTIVDVFIVVFVSPSHFWNWPYMWCYFQGCVFVTAIFLAWTQERIQLIAFLPFSIFSWHFYLTAWREHTQCFVNVFWICSQHLRWSISETISTLFPRWFDDDSVCLGLCGSVCLSVCDCTWRYLRNYMPKLYQIFSACCLLPWLCPYWQHCNMLCASDFIDWRHIFT